MNESKNDLQPQKASRQQWSAFSGALNIGLFFVLAIFVRYLLKFAGGYQSSNVPALPLVMLYIGLVASVIVIDVILWKIGCSRFIRSGFGFSLVIGLIAAMWMFDRGQGLLEAITVGIILFVLAFTVICLLGRRSRSQGKRIA